MVEIACRPATDDEIPKTAKSLAALAEAHGWEVTTTYARGEWPMNRPTRKVIDNLAVKMWRETHLVGIWHDGKFHRGLSRTRTFDAIELRAMVAMSRDELRDYWLGLKALEAIIR